MPAWVHRTTKEYLRSVPAAELPEAIANYIEESAEAATLYAAGVPNIYWKISGDIVSEMTQAEKDAVDAAALQAQRDDTAAQLDQVEEVLRAFMLTVLDEFNAHADKHNAILDAIDSGNNLSQVKANIAAVTDYPQRTSAQLRTTVRNKLGS